MLTISYTTTVTLCDLFEWLSVVKNVLIEVDPFEETHGLLNNRLDKFLCRIRQRLIFATLYKVSIIFGKVSFINVKKVLNLIQSLINEKKVINPHGVLYWTDTRKKCSIGTENNKVSMRFLSPESHGLAKI